MENGCLGRIPEDASFQSKFTPLADAEANPPMFAPIFCCRIYASLDNTMSAFLDPDRAGITQKLPYFLHFVRGGPPGISVRHRRLRLDRIQFPTRLSEIVILF